MTEEVPKGEDWNPPFDTITACVPVSILLKNGTAAVDSRAAGRAETAGPAAAR